MFDRLVMFTFSIYSFPKILIFCRYPQHSEVFRSTMSSELTFSHSSLLLLLSRSPPSSMFLRPAAPPTDSMGEESPEGSELSVSRVSSSFLRASSLISSALGRKFFSSVTTGVRRALKNIHKNESGTGTF